MSCDLPVFSKCCLCIPLRPGMLVLAYLRLIVAILLLLFVLLVVHVQFSAKELAILLALLGVLVANLVFSVIFVVGVHKRDYKLLRVYFSFSIFMLAINIILFLCTMGLNAYLALYYENVITVLERNIIGTISSMVDILLQLYFIAVIRSEILILKAEKVHFTNAGGECRVVLDLPKEKKQDTKFQVLYSDTESEEEVILKKPLFPVDELEKLRQDLEVKKV